MKMSFFEKLRKGVDSIETEVRNLKELTESGVQRSDRQMTEDLNKAIGFDADVRRTYVETTLLYNRMRGSEKGLIEAKNKIKSIKEMLCDIEDNSGIKDFGYKPFAEQYSHSVDNRAIDDNDNNTDGQQVRAYCPDSENTEKTMDLKHLMQELTQNTNESEEKTVETVRLGSDMAIGAKENAKNQRQTSAENKNKPFDKVMGRTPQPYDFGITRRFTLLPQIYNNNNKYISNTTGHNKTPEEPPFESTQTCRFNYFQNNGLNLGSAVNPITLPNASHSMSANNNNKHISNTTGPNKSCEESTQTCRFNYFQNNGLDLGSAVNPITPPNASHSMSANNDADSFVTVEFTPGLTTKRPKCVSRINANNNCNNNRQQKGKDVKPSAKTTQRLPQIVLQSLQNDKITPEQPIPSADSAKSVKLLQSIAGKSSGTPPLPKTTIDPNLHQQILKLL